MKPTILTLVAFVLLPFCPAKGQDSTFTSKDFDSAKVYYKTASIPDCIKTTLHTGMDGKFKMANPGKYYEETDNIMRRNAPRCRLVCFIQLPNNRFLLYYEQGGRGWHTVCMLYELTGNTIKNSYELEVLTGFDPTYDKLKTKLLSKDYYIWKH